MTVEQAVRALYDYLDRYYAYQHGIASITFDGNTAAPEGTADNRARAIAILSAEQYSLATSPETVRLVQFLKEHSEVLEAKEKRITQLVDADIRMMLSVPAAEYAKNRQLIAKAGAVWKQARENNDWPAFEPYLEQIIRDKLRFAALAAPGEAPYDYWLSRYDCGLTQADCDTFFAALKEKIVPLARRKYPDIDCAVISSGPYPEEKQARLAREVMDILLVDRSHCTLATTMHPHTQMLGSHLDSRITTHYYRDDVSRSLFSVLHESGHALYQMGMNDDYAYTPLDDGMSAAVHESQSRFYENIIGRSEGFCKMIFPRMQALFPQMRAFCADDFFRSVNRVCPGPVRLQADEVTYSLHIMVRYELEKALMNRTIPVSALPEKWNALYREYLGVEGMDFSSGVLQDSHWSSGLVGYFPSYALGNAYSAQIWHVMKTDFDVDGAIREGSLAPINAWNREHIWQYGKRYTPQEFLPKLFRGPFDPQYYIDHLADKIRQVYD